MKVVYCALEISENYLIDNTTIARISKLSADAVVVQNMSTCTSGNRKHFAMLTDLYIWTCKYLYGTFIDKLTFVELRGVDTLPTLFALQYSESIRLAISSNRLSIFSNNNIEMLRQASYQSMAHFNEERITSLAPFIPKLEESYDVLVCKDNPFI